MKIETMLEALEAGGRGSGCDPAEAKKAGNVCGRPPGSKTGSTGPALGGPQGVRIETRSQHKVEAIKKALDSEPKESKRGGKYREAASRTYSVMTSDKAKQVLKTGAVVGGQIVMYVMLDRFLIIPAISVVGRGGAAAWKWAKMAKGAKGAKQLSMFAGEEGMKDYAVVVWRKGMRHITSGKKGVGWRDTSVPPELVEAVEFYKAGAKKPYKIVKNKVKK